MPKSPKPTKTIHIPLPTEVAPARRAKKAGRRPQRVVNYHSKSRPATVEKQNLILEQITRRQDGMTVVEVAELLGVSRQLALYHIKKMVATSQLVVVLEPCRDNGGVRFRCWDVVVLARRMAAVAGFKVAA